MNSKTLKVMILYASYGNGHYQASKAIETVFRRKGVTDIVLLDLMAQAHPLINEFTKFVYLNSFKTLPSIYGWIYNATRKMQSETALLRLINSFGTSTLLQAVTSFDPDLVIHTFPQLTLPRLLKKTGMSIPLINIITDFDLHGRWLHPEIHRYYVATDDLKQEMKDLGIPEERIMASGIPIQPDFNRIRQESSHLNNLLHKNKKTILLMAGAYGVMQGNHDICEALTSSSQYQLIVVCGRNKELYRQLTDRFGNHPDVHIYGYINNVADVMTMSDCMITKPGGITLSEAIECRLPLILYRPVPGQELNNALYLQRKGIAAIAHNVDSLMVQINSMLHDETRFQEIQHKINDLRKPEAAEVIVNDIMEQCFVTS
ncbi:processive 1,2-diacylglycerol beta-glucosyltransferase [Fontibacillus solani]|uniref:Processive 1,2-diacylglycerol beta-glucosyltransferase n=1 Tax=Fontibacillus solani TaxID=1572857 RepID=A0A7W3SY33_9BACL|nr:glycosyltransferase [Fontibacillus solani]MBA9088366.1 processive 1,2-diacylglycerol beta-glucosyltransferase [Fontibacillus solani]